LVLAVAAHAQTAPQATPPGAPAARSAAQGRLGAGPAAGLNLTQEQRDRVKGLREARAGDLRAVRERMRGARQQLREAMRADVPDEAAVRAAAEALGAVQADLAVLQARARAEFLKMLTPEQQARLKAARDRAAQRAQRARRGMGARPQMMLRNRMWRQQYLRWWRDGI
jgi:Spy/CpxP family protein refolding chaperone